jgi:hypothetical protein
MVSCRYNWASGHSLVLAVIVNLANATTVVGGIVVGVLVWIGFVVTLEIGELIWEKIPFKLFMIRVGNHLVALRECLKTSQKWGGRANLLDGHITTSLPDRPQ